MNREIIVTVSNYNEESLMLDSYEDDRYPCEPDEFDIQEGTTAVDMAVEVLNLKLYVESASSYPDWQKSTWYTRVEEVYDREEYGPSHKEISAHLVNFSDAEALEIYKRVTARQ